MLWRNVVVVSDSRVHVLVGIVGAIPEIGGHMRRRTVGRIPKSGP